MVRYLIVQDGWDIYMLPVDAYRWCVIHDLAIEFNQDWYIRLPNAVAGPIYYIRPLDYLFSRPELQTKEG